MGLTDNQARVLNFIADRIEHHGAAPKYAEIADYLGTTSKGSVHRYIKALTIRGYITSRRGFTRSIEVLRRPGDAPAPLSEHTSRYARYLATLQRHRASVPTCGTPDTLDDRALEHVAISLLSAQDDRGAALVLRELSAVMANAAAEIDRPPVALVSA